MIGMIMPLISKYSGSFITSQIEIVMIAPATICNGSRMKGFNGIKPIAKTGTDIGKRVNEKITESASVLS